MTFKKLSLIFTAFLTVTSCSDFLKGKPKKQETLVVEKTTLSCLKEVKTQFKDFLKSELDSKEIDQTFDCIDKTLAEFYTRVEGRAEVDSFTSEELFKIFDKYIENSDISREAANELLILKSALLGGSVEKITKKEISELRTFIGVIREEAKNLVPYAALLNFKKPKSKLAKAFIDSGFGQLNVSLKNLFKNSKLKQSEYDFSDFKRLLEQFKIVEADQEDLLNFADLVQKVLIADQPLKSDDDFSRLVDSISEILKLYTYFLNDDVKFEITNSQTVHNSIDFSMSLIDILENSIQFKKTRQISIETLDPLLSKLVDKKFVPVDVSKETLLTFYKILIVRAFDSGLSGQASSLTSLNGGHFKAIRREALIYKTYMNMIDDAIPSDLKIGQDGEARLPLVVVQEKMKSFKPDSALVLKSLDAEQKDLVLKGFNELRSEFLSERPMIYRFKKIVVAVNQEIWDQSWADLARAAYIKVLTRQLMIGWGTAQTTKLLEKSHITEPGLVQWYADFKKFGIESKAFDPRAENSGASNFKQANLLTHSANGDDKLSYYEAVQLLNLLISGGGQTVSELSEGFKKAGCELSDKDVFGNNWIDEKCAVADLHKNFKHYFSNLSYLVSYTGKMKFEDFNKFYYEVLKVTRVEARFAGTRIETADIRATAILFHYIETLYARFDNDRNWNFSAAEVRAAYPRFKSFARDYAYSTSKAQIDLFNGRIAQTVGGFSCYKEDDLIQESFIFLVFYGKTPGISDLNKFPCFRGLPLINFSGEVERKTIINTFKILKSVLGS